MADGDGWDFANAFRDCLGCAVIALDEQQRITALNPRGEQLLELDAGRVLGHPPVHLPPPLQEIIREAFSTGQPITDRRLVLQDSHRGSLAVQLNANPVRGENVNAAGVVLVLNDLSSAKKWEYNMRRIDRIHSVGTLAAGMAHEVKNALVAVRTFVDLLLEKDPQTELAGIVRREMIRVDAILGQMLKISGPAKPVFSTVQIHLVLERSLRLIHHLCQQKKITVTRSLGASSDLITGDQNQLEQALLNLLLNALDAMGKNGTLALSTEIIPANSQLAGLPPGNKKPLLRLAIQDNGVGIARTDMDRLFEPFFTTKAEGTGLGLAITRRIIQEHQGTITVQSDPNRGTTFSLFLPLDIPKP